MPFAFESRVDFRLHARFNLRILDKCEIFAHAFAFDSTGCEKIYHLCKCNSVKLGNFAPAQRNDSKMNAMVSENKPTG